MLPISRFYRRHSRRCALVLVLAAVVASPGAVRAADAKPEVSAEHAAFFEKKVQPILAKRCFACHSHAAKKDSGSLMLDSKGAMLAGGDSGPALEPGKPGESLIITAVKFESDYPQMPPKGKIPDDEIAVLVEWVKIGAPWPGADATVAGKREKITDEDRAYWAFQPVKKVAPPQVADEAWSRNPVDRFLRTRLDAEGIPPSPRADRADLIRRVYFDLIGLPPTPEEIDAFLGDESPRAWENLIDRLLESPRYGERWARHWLDLVRYSESDGYRADHYRENAWRYRDYVIRSFNEDKPYDRFVREQLAGDEIDPENPDAHLATSYLRLGIYEYNSRDAAGQWEIMLNDVTDVTGDVFLGLGMGCARCHDHKFDPILQRDYFRLQAFLAPMLPMDDVPLATEAERADYETRLAAWENETAAILAQIEEIEAPVRKSAAKKAIGMFPPETQAILDKPEAERTPYEKQLAYLVNRQVLYEYERLDGRFKDEAKQKLVGLRKQLSEHKAKKPEPLPTSLTVVDVGREAPPTFIPKKSGEPIEPGFLSVLDPSPAEITPPAGLESTGRRTALANWIARPDNPLSTRVIVNRIWQYHFGQGLVPTASDFGRLGGPPSHPELLDWLATYFVENGWSFKTMHRLILTSEAYRQSAMAPAPAVALQKDPENRLLWRMPNRRLDAEQVRDALLATTGRLDLKMGGPAVQYSTPRRSIYCRVLRNTRDPLLDVFDAPEGFQSTSSRNVTTTPTQALMMINSGFMLEQAAAFAKRLEREHPSADANPKIEAAFRLAFGRAPRDEERAAAVRFLAEQAARISPEPEEALPVVKLDKVPYRDGNAVVLEPQGPIRRAEVPAHPKLPEGDFTIEAFVVLRSLFEDATVRTIAAHWNGNSSSPGWSLGVTSRRSAFKPQMLVLQLWGENAEGKPHYEPVFSSLHIELNRPYFVAVSVKLGETGPEGITFYAKDLSNDDEPLLSSQSSHKVVKIPENRGSLVIGGCADKGFGRVWDGLVDDVRLSNRALKSEELLLTRDNVGDETVAYWQFEPQRGVLKDASPNQIDLRFGSTAKKPGAVEPATQALIDFCHVLLNASEFLYVD